MLPPESTTTAGVSNAVGSVEHRRDRGGAGRLDDQLGALEQQQQRPGQRLLARP